LGDSRGETVISLDGHGITWRRRHGIWFHAEAYILPMERPGQFAKIRQHNPFGVTKLGDVVV
jgi:hypothetical protein